MKRIQKIFSVILSLCLLAGAFACMTVSTSAEEVQTKWVNNDGNVIPAQDACQSLFAKVDPVFSFGCYLRGSDTTAGTAWNSTDANADVNLWAVDGNASIYDGYKYSCWPAYNQGVKFTAPYTGTIKVTYQLGQGEMTNCSLIVAKDDTMIDGYGGTYNYISETTVIGADFTEQKTMELDVTAGQNLYFIMKNLADYHHGYFWINSLEYTSVKLVGTASMLGHSISAMDTPVVNFYVKLDGSPMGVAANITVGTDAPISVVGEAYTGVGPDGENFTAEDYVYVYSVPVSAKRMTETITISLVKDGEEMLKTNNTYSVAEYCNAQVEAYNAAGSEATEAQISLAKVCTGVLIYGRTAQQYFGYNLENLPTIDSGVLALVSADCSN
ncbi:MAG: hypothetical protein ACI3XQ_02380 [Eubacteriales bacterium]